MFSLCKNLMKLTSQAVKQSGSQFSCSNLALKTVVSDCCRTDRRQNFHTSTPRKKVDVELEIRKAAKEASKKTLVREDFDIDEKSIRSEVFPTIDLPNTKFDGIPFKDLPVINIKVSRNNTILNLVDEGIVKIVRSCGTEGFKNSRKGTNIAAQTAGTALGLRALRRGYKTAKVVIKGLGPGRLSGVKGVQLAGVNVVSITDMTQDSTTLRPRKQRRI